MQSTKKRQRKHRAGLKTALNKLAKGVKLTHDDVKAIREEMKQQTQIVEKICNEISNDPRLQ